MINEKETTMPSNEEIIRNLYAVAEKEPKSFRSLFTKNGYWWDVPAGVKYRGDEARSTVTTPEPSCSPSSVCWATWRRRSRSKGDLHLVPPKGGGMSKGAIRERI